MTEDKSLSIILKEFMKDNGYHSSDALKRAIKSSTSVDIPSGSLWDYVNNKSKRISKRDYVEALVKFTGINEFRDYFIEKSSTKPYTKKPHTEGYVPKSELNTL